MKSKRILSLLAVAALATTVLVGCGSKDKANALKDGKYEAKSEKDDRGYVSQVNIEVKDGKIAVVKFDEVNAETGVKKSTDEKYNADMLQFGSASNPKEAFPKLEKALIEKQDADAVDVVSAVTTSSNTFKTLAAKALADAK